MVVNLCVSETCSQGADAPRSEALDLARECLYRFFAAALSDPHGGNFQLIRLGESQQLACLAADLLREAAGETPKPPGFGELPAEGLSAHPICAYLRESIDELQGEHARVFGLLAARECPPYETEYHPPSEPFFRAQQLADIAGFYRAFGVDTSQATHERPDHIALELEFMALVLMKKRRALAEAGHDPAMAERARVCDGVERSFFRDHLAWWASAFAAGLRRRAGAGFYAALAQVLAAFLFTERVRLNIEALPLPIQPDSSEPPEEQAGCAGCSLAGGRA